jgi:hypothetical protein
MKYKIDTSVELNDKQKKEILELERAYETQKSKHLFAIGYFLKSYVESCIVIPKYLSKDKYNTPMPFDNVRVTNHSDMDSDLFNMMSYIIETMIENQLDKDCVKDMFQSLLDLSFHEDEDNFESELL